MSTFSLLREKFLSRKKTNAVRLEDNKVRVAIENACREYLLDSGDVLTFEAQPNALDSTLEVIEEPSLTAKYEFYQISETEFQVRMKEFILL